MATDENRCITIQIGNSDNKLTQQEWSSFCKEIDSIVSNTIPVHFSGHSLPNKPWQNACWVGEYTEEDAVQRMLSRIKLCRETYKQDSVAVTFGTTQLI